MAKSKVQVKIDELNEAHKESSQEVLIKALAESELAKEAAEADKVSAEKDIEVLNKTLSDYESGKVKKLPKPTVKVGNNTFIINSPKAKIKGVVFTADQIKENKETVLVKGKAVKIADFLVNIKSGVLVPKPDKK